MSNINKKIKVVIVDDHSRVRAGIRRLLDPVDDVQVVGEGGDGSEALQLVEQINPDILLLDVELPVLRGEAVTRLLHQSHPEVKVLAVSSYTDRSYIQGMMKNGAVGYITKDEAPALLVDAIHSIHKEDKIWVSPLVKKETDLLLPDEKTLTSRDIEILGCLVDGKTIDEVSVELSIPDRIVEEYIRLLMIKFNVETIEELTSGARSILQR